MSRSQQNLYTAIAFVVIVVFFLLLRSCERKQSAEVINSYEDSLSTVRNHLGQEVATNHLIVDAYTTVKAISRQKDSVLNQLQAIIDRKTYSATILSTATHHTQSGKTKIEKPVQGGVFTLDTRPVYLMNKVSEWGSVSVRATADSIYFFYNAYNKFEIKQTWKRKWFLSRKQNYVEVTSLNPNTITTGLRSFKLESTTRNFSLGLFVGVGIDEKFKPKPIAGFGIQYNLISF